MPDFEGASEAVNSRHEYNERTKDIENIDKKLNDIDKLNDLDQADKDRLKKNLKASKTQYQNELNEIAKKHTEHLKTLKKSIVEKLNSDSEVQKQMGRNIKVSEIDFDKYSEENNDPKSAQYHFNKLVNDTTSELNDRMKKVFDGEKIDYKKPGFLRRIWEKMPSSKTLEKMLNIAIALSIAGDITEIIISKSKEKKDIDAIIKSYNGCYQVDSTTGDLITGPCKCEFDFSNDDGVGTCSDKIVLSTKNTDLKKLITDNKPSFCTHLPNNMVVPCKYANKACSAYQKNNPLAGSCTVGQCKNPSGENDPNSGKWQEDLSNDNIQGIPVCLSSQQYVMELFNLNDQSVDWVPTPTPPLIILISIIGILMILLTVLWYILYLIRQERKMSKK